MVIMVVFCEVCNGRCPCPSNVQVSTLEHMELGLLWPSAAWAFTCLVHVRLLFTCVEPSV